MGRRGREKSWAVLVAVAVLVLGRWGGGYVVFSIHQFILIYD